jgi:hypothetical protein
MKGVGSAVSSFSTAVVSPPCGPIRQQPETYGTQPTQITHSVMSVSQEKAGERRPLDRTSVSKFDRNKKIGL